MERLYTLLLLLKMVLSFQDKSKESCVSRCCCCDAGWVEFRGFCYYFSTTVAGSWVSARKTCLSQGSDLTSVHSLEEQDFLNDWMERINESFGTAYFWNGATDKKKEGSFKWCDKTSWGYTNWLENEPNEYGEENCVEMYSSGKWNDLNCFSPGHRYICKK
uniref:Toxin candidate TRINITY_DN17816_c0_g1_i1.p1 n=1 Tax=Isarachnanthus nocturnus TaxID=1240238 RepID=A0A7G7WYX1_9CNID|nr:toxin candidate TRINITY_DN17816_c0_g1_i1.p1 [Isarachnanthus nocturnus]